jgi:acetoin utilization deacetylase AcuC-like enzyme
MDPLAHMMLTSEAYRAMTRALVDLSECHCGGRLVYMHEGGYRCAVPPPLRPMLLLLLPLALLTARRSRLL